MKSSSKKGENLVPGNSPKNLPDGFIFVPNTHWNSLYEHRRLLSEQISTMAILMQGRILDVGCGTQPYRSLLTNATSYTGVDVNASPHSLSQDVILYDGVSLPFPDQQFDWVLATEIFEHCAQPEQLMRSIARVLCSSGGLVMTVPFLAGIHEPPNDYQRWTNFGLERLLRGAGFSDVKITAMGNWHQSASFFLAIYLASCRWPWWTKGWLPRVFWLVRLWIASFSVPANPTMCIGWFVVAKKSAP
jgi:SAM-dependent methyltransferase